MRQHSLFQLFLLGSLIVAGMVAPSSAADTCQPVFDALTKVATTPRHTYTSHTTASTPGKPRSSETILADGKVYIRVNDKWMKSPASPQDMLEQQKENREHGKATCHFVRNEQVGAESVAVYSMQSETDGGKENAQIWISKNSGLPVRDEQDVDVGGSTGKEHRSTRFEYGNIRPPM